MTRSPRLLLTAAVVLSGSVAAAPAALAAKPARLSASTLTGLPGTLTPGAALTAKGRVRNTGGRASAAQLSFKLRTLRAPYVAVTLGGGRIAKVPAGASRTFATKLTVPAALKVAAAPDGYVLVVCVSRSRADRSSVCRKTGSTTDLRPAPTTVPTPAAPAPPAPAPAPDATRYVSGARSLGDTLFPTIGNGGYDVAHYDIDLSYDIASQTLAGSSTARMAATQNLKDFSFDLTEYLVPSAVTVDGAPAAFVQDPASDKLVVTPATPIKQGTTFSTKVTYGGVEHPFIDPDGSAEGWIPDPVRGAIVVSEPVGAKGWFPNNDVPFDKATYTISVSVPEDGPPTQPWSIIGPGVKTAETVADGARHVTWQDDDQTASYLVGLAIGKFDVATTPTRPTTANPVSVPFTTAIDSSIAPNKAAILARLGRTPSIQNFYAGFYGLPYPFSSQGGIVPLVDVGYSLETQSKPTYSISTNPATQGPDIDTVAHENGHMYFGDYLTLTQWKDIWLNEGMTEFSSELWGERANGGETLDATFARKYSQTETDLEGDDLQDFWLIAPAAPPTAADIFDTSAMYDRGSMTMIGLLDILGETNFKQLMHDDLVQAGHPYGNTTTEQFIALVKAEDLAARTALGRSDRTARWTEYFRQWLYTSYAGDPDAGNKPQITAANFDSYPVG